MMQEEMKSANVEEGVAWRPDWPWGHDFKMVEWMLSMNSKAKRARTELRALLDLEVKFDEVAVLMPSRRVANDFVEQMVAQPEVKLFNVARDKVETRPFWTDYRVRYQFLEVAHDKVDMRVEVMDVEQGFSPLHFALLENHPHSFIPVHLSFKCANEEVYDDVFEKMDQALNCVQECSSTYGRFAYFDHPSGIYIKPRVNVRDQGISRTADDRADKPVADRGEFGMPGIGGRLIRGFGE